MDSRNRKTTRRQSAKKVSMGGRRFPPIILGLILLLVLGGYGWFRWATDQTQKRARAANAQGNILRDQGRLGEAEPHYWRAVEEWPDLARGWSNLGVVFTAREQYGQALEYLDRALELDPDLFETHMGLAIVHDHLGNFSPAEAHYQQAIRLKPHFAEVYFNLGYLYQQEGFYHKALDQYELALQRKPDFLQAWSNTGLVYSLQQKPGKAIQALNRALEVVPEDGYVRMQLAKSYMDLGDYAHARQAYQRILELGERRFEPYYGLGYISEQEGRLEEASTYYRQAIQADSTYAESYYRLGVVLEVLGDPETPALYLKTIEIDPDHAAAYYSLARLYLRQGRREEGRQLVQVFQGLKEYEKEQKARQKALERSPGDAEAVHALGLVHFKYRRNQRARELFEKALKMDPDFAPAREKLEQLGQGPYSVPPQRGGSGR